MSGEPEPEPTIAEMLDAVTGGEGFQYLERGGSWGIRHGSDTMRGDTRDAVVRKAYYRYAARRPQAP
jgi:hypothetical protein